MTSFDDRCVVTFNGEIYNFEELKPILKNNGIGFRGHSDTEVLVNSIALWKTGALEKLDGMFAFAAFDKISGELLLVRDPFGEKPLYYQELPDGGLAFASELHAFESLPQFDGEVSLESMAELLMFEYIAAPRSIYRTVKKLPPGHWMQVTPGKSPRIERYFEFQPGNEEFDERPMEELADELEEILIRSLRRRVVADVPLGAFLSGGVDSSTICALIQKKLGLSLKTFSIGFEGADESEHDTARCFAEHLGSDHNERIITPSSVELLADLGQFLDEPCSDWSCLPVYLLSGFAREQVTVAISGDGGDELFGGYDRYSELLNMEQNEAKASKTRWAAGESYYNWGLLALDEHYTKRFFGVVPPGVSARLRRLRDEVSKETPSLLNRMRKSDVENYLPGAVLTKVDRMSMQHSLEIRTPFLNLELAHFAERLPESALHNAGRSKRILRELAYRYLPKDLIDQPKLGFGMPNDHWARNKIHEVAGRLLRSDDSRLRECFGGEVLEQSLSLHWAVHRWWTLAMFESWCRHHPAKLPRISNSGDQGA